MALLAGRAVHIGQPILVHDPVGLLSPRCFSGVKHQGLLNSDGLGMPNGLDGLIGSCGLPIPTPRGPVRSRPVRVLPVPRWKEIPFFLPVQGQSCKFTNFQFIKKKNSRNETKKVKNIMGPQISQPKNFKKLGDENGCGRGRGWVAVGHGGCREKKI